MRRTLYILAIAMLALLAAPGASAQDKSFVWQRIDSDVQVRQDGSLRVVETLTLRFSGGSFSFAYRDLPERRLDGISNIVVADDERSYRQVDDDESEEPFTYAVFREDGAQRVRWVYPPSEGERTFRLSYDVAGAVRRYESVDEVWWSVVFPDREETVEQAGGRIALPQQVPAAQLAADAPDADGSVAVEPGAATVTAADIPPGVELSLRLTFPSGITGGALPQWQQAELAQASYNADTRPIVNVVLSAAAAGLALLLGVLVVGWYRRNRDPRPYEAIASSYYTMQPPSELPPAMAAELAGRPNHDAFMATLLDLANRGYLTVAEQAGKRGKRPRIELTDSGAARDRLLPFERQVLETVFGGAGTVELNERAGEIGTQLGEFDKLVQAELAPRGYFRPAGQRARNVGMGIGFAMLMLGGVAVVPAVMFAQRISWWLPVLAAVVVVAGIALMAAGSMVHGLSVSGAEERARWQGFGSSLSKAEPGRAPTLGFADLLPFAYAFGAGNRLGRAYGNDAGVPVWYYSSIMHSSSGGEGVSDGEGIGGSMPLSDFSQNFITSLDSTASSAAGGGSGGGGGGGASGGGGGGAG